MLRTKILFLLTVAAQFARAQEPNTTSDHIAPDPPQYVMPDMPYRTMVGAMQMDDTARVGKIMLDRLEWRASDHAGAWDAQAWFGGDYNKFFFKSEGDREGGDTQDARAELLWDRIVARRWNLQLGVREDFGEGPKRTWGAIGIEGLAPYWFEVDAALYIRDAGNAAARIRIDYDLLFTQRLVLRAEIEANAYGEADRERQIGSGLSDIATGLRLRYEFRREFAPYIGISYRRKFGGTANYAEAMGLDSRDTQFVSGLRIWF